MTDTTRKTLVGALGIVALGLVVGIANNLLAGPERHLEWKGSYPPKGEPACKTFKEPGVDLGLVTAAGSTAAEAPAGDTGAAPTPAPTGAVAAAVDIPPVPSGQQYLELDPPQVKALHDKGALFIDARRSEEYRESHVQGAISIAIWESGVDEKIANVMFAPQVQGDMNAPMVLYCHGGDCQDSKMLAEKLWQAGHTAIYVYKDGFPNWTDNKWPVASGDQP